MRLPNSNFFAFLEATQVRYLIAGAWNTAFGYGTTIFFYYFLFPQFGTIVVGIVSNVVAITMSFVIYKLFVFRTDGGWFREYLKCYVVYGGTGAMGILILWFLVENAGLNIWIAQGISLILVLSVSYFGHKKLTFDGGKNT